MEEPSHSENGASTNDGLLKKFADMANKPAFTDKELKMSGPMLRTTASKTESVSGNKLTKSFNGKTALSQLKPTEMFAKYFSGKPLTKAQMITGTLDKRDMAIPQRVVGVLQQRVKGATTRIGTRKTKIQSYRVILKTGVMLKNDVPTKITPLERKMIQDKKFRAEAELLKAKTDLRALRDNLEAAMIANSLPTRNTIKSVREMDFIKRMAPSVAKKIIEQVENNPEAKKRLLDLPKAESASTFLEVVKEGNPKVHKLLSGKPKMATQVKQRVMEQLAISAKETK